MLCVIDANELFSILIKESKFPKEILLSNEVELIAPEFLLIEFSNNKEEILSKTHRTEDEFLDVLFIFEDRIKLIPEQEFKDFIEEAYNLLPEHIKDVPYLALALRFRCLIWSEDKSLKNQSKVEIFNTKELSKMLRL